MIPIVIGTIPLRSTFSESSGIITPTSPSAPLLPAEKDLPPKFSASKDIPSTGPFSAFPGLPPPTYEEAKDLPSMRMEDDNEHTMSNWD